MPNPYSCSSRISYILMAVCLLADTIYWQ